MGLVYYVIRPQPNLYEVLKSDVTWFYTKTHVWEHDEYIGGSSFSPNPEFRIQFLKIIFLIELINYSRAEATKQELQKLLGQPLEFSIAMFDKWWSIERVPLYKTTDMIIKHITHEKLKHLDIDGHDSIIEEIMSRRQELIEDANHTE